MACQSIFTYLQNASPSIGSEDDGKYLGDDIIELGTIVGIDKFRAIGARAELMIDTAGAQLAPGCFSVLLASRTFILPISSAGTTIQSTIGHKICTFFDLIHKFLPKNEPFGDSRFS